MTLKIISFLKKYKRKIIFWIILLFLTLYFQPHEQTHYLDNDIDAFKDEYLSKVLIICGGVLIIVSFFLAYRYQKKIVGALTSTLHIGFIIFCLLFFSQDLILSSALFVNREFDNTIISKKFTVSYMMGTPKERDFFSLYDPSTKHIIADKKLLDLVYDPKLKQFDTVNVNFGKGLFGIKYLPTK